MNDIKIQENIALSKYTTFRIGGPAKYFVIVKDTEDLIETVKFAQNKKLPHFVLGGGSNLLVSDQGFKGIVIKTQNSEFQISDYKIVAEAGVPLAKLVSASMTANLTGLEWAAGIPGTIGGAVRGNAGAFGHHTAESVKKVKSLDSKLQITNYKLQDLEFGYRDSVFKYNCDIILSVELELKKGNQEKSQQMIKKYLTIRREKNPVEASAGSIFKNIEFEKLEPAIKDLIPQEKIKKGMLATAYLIEQCGLKGKKSGQAMIAEKYPNFIISLGQARAADVVNLIELIKKNVQEKFKFSLEEEIQYLGF